MLASSSDVHGKICKPRADGQRFPPGSAQFHPLTIMFVKVRGEIYSWV